jgi:hypothetical protein
MAWRGTQTQQNGHERPCCSRTALIPHVGSYHSELMHSALDAEALHVSDLSTLVLLAFPLMLGAMRQCRQGEGRCCTKLWVEVLLGCGGPAVAAARVRVQAC